MLCTQKIFIPNVNKSICMKSQWASFPNAKVNMFKFFKHLKLESKNTQINYYQSFACYTPVYITVHTCICFTLTL